MALRSPTIVSYHWTFPDGTTSTAQNAPAHVFNQSEWVTLSETDSDGFVSTVKAYVSVAGLSSYYWNFGDGTIRLFIDPDSFTHLFNVSSTVTIDNGGGDQFYSQDITVIHPTPPQFEETALADPQMILTVSKDGGYTWSKPMLQSMGKVGKFKQRIIWPHGLGISRDWVFRFRSFAPVRHVWIAAFADVLPEEE